ACTTRWSSMACSNSNATKRSGEGAGEQRKSKDRNRLSAIPASVFRVRRAASLNWPRALRWSVLVEERRQPLRHRPRLVEVDHLIFVGHRQFAPDPLDKNIDHLGIVDHFRRLGRELGPLLRRGP